MREIISRLVSPFVAMFVVFLASRGLNVGPDFEAALNELVWWLLMASGVAGSGALHKLIDRKVNPMDSASPAAVAVREAQSTPVRR